MLTAEFSLFRALTDLWRVVDAVDALQGAVVGRVLAWRVVDGRVLALQGAVVGRVLAWRVVDDRVFALQGAVVGRFLAWRVVDDRVLAVQGTSGPCGALLTAEFSKSFLLTFLNMAARP